MTAVPPLSPATATSTSRPPGTGALKLRPAIAASTAEERRAGTPSTRPSGRKTVTRWGPCAFSSATTSVRGPVSSRATDGASTSNSPVAAASTRSATVARTSSAIGTRKATSTSELVAATRATRRALIPWAPLA